MTDIELDTYLNNHEKVIAAATRILLNDDPDFENDICTVRIVTRYFFDDLETIRVFYDIYSADEGSEGVQYMPEVENGYYETTRTKLLSFLDTSGSN